MGLLWILPIFIPLYIDNLFSLLTLIAFPLAAWTGFNSQRQDYRAWCFVIFAGYTAVVAGTSGTLNAHFFKYLTLTIEGYVVYFIVTKLYSWDDVEWIILWVARFSLVAALIVFYQYFTGSTDEYVVNDTQGYRTYQRMAPRGADPNYYFLHLVLPLSFFGGNFLLSENLKRRLLITLFGTIILANIVGLASKSAILITVVLLALLFARDGKRHLVFLAVALTFAFPFLMDNFEYTAIRLQTLVSGYESGNTTQAMTGRNILYSRTLSAFAEAPMTGKGLGQLVREYGSTISLAQKGLGTTHNSFLHLLGETGLIGALIYFTPMFMTLFRAFQRRNERWLNKVLFVALFASFLMLLTIDAFYYKAFIFVYALSVLNTHRAVQ